VCKTVFRRLIGAVVTLFCATLVLFIIIRLAPGDPIEIMLGRPGDLAIKNTPAYEARVAELHAQLGLDQDMLTQYGQWLKRLVSLELGTSIHTGREVSIEIAERIPATLMLSLAAILIQLVSGVVFGIVSAIRAGKILDHVIRLFCVFFASVPAFVIGLVLLMFFAVTYHIYEISGDANIYRLWLPAITLGLVGAPQLIRMVRANILSELGQTYIVSAISRGLPKKQIMRHALKNAMLPIVTMMALSFTNLIAGSVVIESIFSWPGIGNYAMNSVLLHDYPVIQGYAVIMVSVVIMANLLVELLYMLIDPRLRNRSRLERGLENE